MTQARDLADLISSGKIELGEIATATQDDLGNTDLYGFKKTNGTGEALQEFNAFAIKIVMQGTNSSLPPQIKDFRSIALAT